MGKNQHAALWKRSHPVNNPHLLSNELVCYRIAKELGLPVPDSFPLPVVGELPVFVQMSFTGNGPLTPPVTPDQCAAAVAEHPLLTAKIVAFDILVMNTDRHAGNLAFRSAKTGADLLVIFDHGHAVFGAPGQEPAPKRFKRVDWLGCDGNPGSRHCLLDHIEDSNVLDAALSSTRTLTDDVLKQALQTARGFGLSTEESNRAYDALSRRRDRLHDVVAKNRKEFKKITQWGVI